MGSAGQMMSYKATSGNTLVTLMPFKGSAYRADVTARAGLANAEQYGGAYCGKTKDGIMNECFMQYTDGMMSLGSEELSIPDLEKFAGTFYAASK